tara:strand:- start:5189 stop:6400 length:1212 start_codon:yes stop_codon:yes gene_type:complete
MDVTGSSMKDKLNDLIVRINEFCLYLVVFSMVFEYWDPLGFGDRLSIAFISMLLYITSSLPFIKFNFNQSILKRYIAPLLILMVVSIVSATINDNHVTNLIDIVDIRFVQLVFLTFLISIHLGQKHILIDNMLKLYVVCVCLMYLLYILNIGVIYEKGRLLLFGENPNMVGLKASIALITAIYFIIHKINYKKVLIGIIVCFPLINLIFLSASRGALVSSILGILLMLFFMKISIVKKMFLIVIMVFSSTFFMTYLMTSQKVFYQRIENAINTGNTGRNILWEGAFRIIEDNPFIGVSIPGMLPEMYKYSGIYNGPHNVYLYVLVTTGILGFVFYMTFIIRLGKKLYTDFKQTGMILYLTIFLVVLFNMFKAGGGINKIVFWFFFAICIASTLPKKGVPQKSI